MTAFSINPTTEEHLVTIPNASLPQVVYPNFYVAIDTNEPNVQAFLPFVAKYTFLEAFGAINELLNHALSPYAFRDTSFAREKYQILHRLSQDFLNIHAHLVGWKQQVFTLIDLDELFDQLIVDAPTSSRDSLKAIRHLDEVMQLQYRKNFAIGEQTLLIATEVRKTFFRAYALRKGFDFENYLIV